MVADWIVWWGLLVLLGLALSPLAAVALPGFPDRGRGVAKALALVLFTYVSWLATSLGMPHRISLVATALSIGVLGAATAARLGLRARRADWLLDEGLFFGAMALFAFLRSLDPAIFGAEKYMDFAFFNTLLRAEHFPPEDPWLSGKPLNYYYFGYLLFANLSRATGIAPEVAYNLSLATVGAVLFAGTVSIGRYLGGRLRHGLAAGGVITLLGNLDGARQLWIEGKRIADFDYWRSTRVVPNTINEFPFFSFLHGDLHPHVTALAVNVPLVALAIGAWRTAREPEIRAAQPIRLALIVLLLGALALTNPWDLPVYFTLLGLLALHRFRDDAHRLRGLVRAGFAVGAAALGMILLSLPFSLGFHAQFQGIGRVHDTTPLGAFATVFGLLLAPPLGFAALEAARSSADDPETRDLLLAAGAFTCVALYVVTGNAVLLLTAALVVAAVGAFLEPQRPSPLAPSLALLATAATAVLACEVVFLRDPYGADLHRMNTVFKLYFQAWWLLGVVFPSFAAHLLASLVPRSRAVFAGALLVGVAASFCYPAALTTLRWQNRREGFSLDGLRYLDREHPDDAALVRWLARNASGLPVVLEATGDAYSYFARVSSNTGLPTVLGWANHEGLWRGGSAEIEGRRTDVDTIYRDPDVDRALGLCERYRVRYVFVGDLERERFPGGGLEKFTRRPDLFTSVLRSGQSELFELRRFSESR